MFGCKFYYWLRSFKKINKKFYKKLLNINQLFKKIKMDVVEKCKLSD